jgi:hypothetical protein
MVVSPAVLIFRSAVFLHVPKTGGIWVREVVKTLGLQAEPYLVDGDIHGDLSYCPCPTKFTFAFVRHPHDLYRSYWRFKMSEGWDPRNPFDMDCRDDRFDAFVDNVLARYPAWCSSMFEDYVGPPNRPISFIGRFDCLRSDLALALRLAGEPVDDAIVAAEPARNPSVVSADLARWTPDRFKAVAQSERRAFERFGYAPEAAQAAPISRA